MLRSRGVQNDWVLRSDFFEFFRNPMKLLLTLSIKEIMSSAFSMAGLKDDQMVTLPNKCYNGAEERRGLSKKRHILHLEKKKIYYAIYF